MLGVRSGTVSLWDMGEGDDVTECDVCSHDSMCGREEVPGPSHVMGATEQQTSPRHSHCCVHHTPQYTTSLRQAERESNSLPMSLVSEYH